MPQRKNSNKKDPSTSGVVTLRRSPRFLQMVLVNPENPITPNPEPRKRNRVPSSVTPLQRLNLCGDKPNAVTLSHTSNQKSRELERRVTRSTCGLIGNMSNGCSSSEQITEEGMNKSKRSKGRLRKNKVKESKKRLENNVDDIINEGALLFTEKQVLDEELSEKYDKCMNEVDVNTAIVVHEGPTNVMDVNKMRKSGGIRRTRNEFENSMGLAHGWTKDQELALERACLEAKPTPQFWKKVSRLVPGKSAQECFDKVHGNHLTPTQPRVRSRPRVSKSLQSPCLSSSKLLNPSSPTAKRPRYHKQKSHVAQRTVRHMLQNQYKVEQESEADLFSVLEPTFNESVSGNLMFTTPDRNPSEVIKRCQERSSTAQKKSVSKFSSLYTTTLVSPPVLKQVKNNVLHEKYIDQLNRREAIRKAASAKAEKLHKSKGMKQESSTERMIAIKAAKNTLIFGARDAINDFQHLQATVLSNLFDCESGADTDKDDSQVFYDC